MQTDIDQTVRECETIGKTASQSQIIAGFYVWVYCYDF